MPRHIIESSEVFCSEELGNDSPTFSHPQIHQILKTIYQKSADDMELRQENKQFMDTLHLFLECKAKMDAKCDEMEDIRPLQDCDLMVVVDDFELETNTYNTKYQQQSMTGIAVKDFSELYDAAKKARPIFCTQLEDFVREFCHSVGAKDGESIVLDISGLKSAGRAVEKATKDYERHLPGPAASWLYDVVRGSITFVSSDHLRQFVETIENNDFFIIVQSKNRFQKPAFTGYRDWCLHIQMDTGLGFRHICELQLHCQAVKDLSVELGSYAYYEYFRCYFGDTDRNLDDRVEELTMIATGKKYNVSILDSFMRDTANVDRLKRLSHLFHCRLAEYEIAAKLECHILVGAKVCEVADSHQRLGEILMKQGLLEEAKWMHETALQIRSETVGVKHKLVASSYSHLGLVFEKEGQTYTAMSMHNKALRIRLETVGKQHVLVASSYHKLGAIYENLGRLQDAKSMYQKALETRLDTLGDKDLSVAISHSNIAGVLEQQGSYEEALVSHKHALQIRRELFGDKHRSVAYSLNKIGGVLKEMEQYQEATSMHQQALDIQLDIFGEKNPSVATSYSNLGAILIRQAKYDEAKVVHENALRIRLETLGDKHISVANSYSTLGVILVKQRQYEEGRIMHDHALRIRLEMLGEKHVSVASSYHCLGVVLEKQGEYKEAERMHKKALDIRSEILGEHHSTVSTSSKRLNIVLEKQEVDENRPSESKRTASMIRSTVTASYNCFRSVLKKPKQMPKETSAIARRNGRRVSAK
ncbi:unnamed protein product [Cylindrotheca closterium]|uniref:Nephrocystin-3 n=1 Tax=Cylindrotheca closterium TaxID=2856 RepID=A0AAD2FRG3_9STRA|nr:unnamed protein product [Cylindrotheca closterium]